MYHNVFQCLQFAGHLMRIGLKDLGGAMEGHVQDIADIGVYWGGFAALVTGIACRVGVRLGGPRRRMCRSRGASICGYRRTCTSGRRLHAEEHNLRLNAVVQLALKEYLTHAE
jgi:hypothetical protein